MSEFAAIWASLDAETRESTGPVDGKLVRRRVLPGAQVAMYFAVSAAKRDRYLILVIPDSWDLLIEDLPRWSGMEIEMWPARHEYADEFERLLALRQTDPAYTEVFEAVVSDVCLHLAQLRDADDGLAVLISVLKKWQSFFKKHGFEGLSPEMQQGLFGELHLLDSCLISKLGTAEATASWTGGDRTTHDFQAARGSIEVKTTRSKEPKRVWIANERQLDDRGLPHLLLVVVSLEVRRHNGVALPQLVHSIRRKLTSDAASLARFEDGLLEYGYMDVHEGHYGAAYFVESIQSYVVVEGFPRLLESDLPEGVGDLSYSISLAACSRFKVDLDAALDRLSSQQEH